MAKLSQQKKEELSHLAEFIADEYCPDSLVNPLKIADAKEITYSLGHYKNSFDGMLQHEFGRFHIYLNKDRLQHTHTTRARFTLAHELGHFFIDDHRNALSTGRTPSHPSITNFSSKNIVEREADFFAACLLMPENRIKSDCFRRKFDYSIIDELSKKYQTSVASTVIRFAEIGNHPIMVVVAKDGIVQWKWASQDFKYYKLKNGDYIPEDTAAGEFYKSKTTHSTTQEVYADDWFHVWDKRYDQKFHEHCLAHSASNYTLSVIWED
jgi:Zn-dependent peptidase ImmA (M78 family)